MRDELVVQSELPRRASSDATTASTILSTACSAGPRRVPRKDGTFGPRRARESRRSIDRLEVTPGWGGRADVLADGLHAVIRASTAARRSVSAAVGSVFWEVSFTSSARPGHVQLCPYARSSFVFEIGNHFRRPGAVRPACVQRRQR